MAISRFRKILIARVVACVALVLVAVPARAAAQETTAEAPARRPAMDDPDGIGRLALEALAALYRAGARPTRGLMMLRAEPGGAEPAVHFVRSDVPDSARAAVRPVVDAFLARRRGQALNVSIQLTEETLAVLAGDWEWGPDQAPVLRNERQFQERIDQVAREAMGASSTWTPERGSEYSLLVSPGGNVVVAYVVQSGLGGAQEPGGDGGRARHALGPGAAGGPADPRLEAVRPHAAPSLNHPPHGAVWTMCGAASG